MRFSPGAPDCTGGLLILGHTFRTFTTTCADVVPTPDVHTPPPRLGLPVVLVYYLILLNGTFPGTWDLQVHRDIISQLTGWVVRVVVDAATFVGRHTPPPLRTW